MSALTTAVPLIVFENIETLSTPRITSYNVCYTKLLRGDLSVAEVVVTISGKANNIPVAINDRRATTINTERTVNVLLNDLGLADGGIIVTAITLPVHGTSVVNTDNTIKYTPANGYLGLDSLQYRVCDIDNECDTAWVIINTKLKNEIPSAAADVATTWLNTKVNRNNFV